MPKIREIVINRCHGGFNLSIEAINYYAKLKGLEVDHIVSVPTYDNDDYIRIGKSIWHPKNIERDDPILVQVVKELGEKANGINSQLKIIELDYDTRYEIGYCDGKEKIFNYGID